MKRIYFLVVTTFFALSNYAQVGVGTTSPRAALEISNTTNGGVLIPKYALSGNNDATTVVNPQGGALETGTLVYNTTAVIGSNALAEGFVFWNGTLWSEVSGTTTTTGGSQIMLRRFTASTVNGSGTVFNFPAESFNTITGASYSGTSLTLPTGVYIIESDLRLNQRETVDWGIRLDGSEIANSIRGSASSENFNSNAGESNQVAMFEITSATGVIDFQVFFNSGGLSSAVLASQCYLKVEKVN
ncbi:MAG: hypothetical protein AAFP76_07590 [Bacteroidota bacterium]